MSGPIDAPGPLYFIGGSGWSDGAAWNAALAAHAEGEIVVIPTGAAYERPDRAIAAATSHFGGLGATVVPAMVLTRRDAENAELAAIVRSARCCYLAGGSPLHLRSVLKDSAVLAALVAAWHGGAAVAGSGAGATSITDPMVDPRGGAFTVGLGLVRSLAVVGEETGEMTAGLRRTLALAPAGCPIVVLRPGGALWRQSDGLWRTAGEGAIDVYLDGAPAGLEVLAGKPTW